MKFKASIKDGPAFKPGAKVGSLVGRPISDYDTYIVGMLYTTRKKGTPGYEEIKSDIEKDFRVAKKNEIITKNLSGKTLDELALSESVKPGEVAFNNMNNIDAKVIGSFALKLWFVFVNMVAIPDGSS